MHTKPDIVVFSQKILQKKIFVRLDNGERFAEQNGNKGCQNGKGGKIPGTKERWTFQKLHRGCEFPQTN